MIGASNSILSKERLPIPQRDILVIVGTLILSSIIGVAIDLPLLVITPLGLIFLLACLYDVRIPLFLLFAMIPLSWEQELGGGFGTDVPTEPLMVLSLGITLVYILRKMDKIDARLLTHPLSILLLAHYAWIWATALYSENLLVSVKFGLAKTWYIAAFYILPILVIRSQRSIRILLHLVLVPLVVVTAIILFRHSLEGFSFESANFVVGPFFRNHVTSAALMATFIPLVVLLWWSSKNVLLRGFYILGLVLMLLGVYFSYTRAAHISILLAIMVYPILRWRLMKLVIGAALIGATVFVVDVVQDNEYLKYAPDFETTISHKTFEDLVDATYQGKDISTMERVYRWVAGFRMVGEKPWTGFGPGNFYNFYKSYTLTLFETYVSDNPEKSGIHCYYLMLLTEQGFIGLALFLLLIIAVLLQFEGLYHRLEDIRDRWLVVALTAVFVIILLFQIINDLIETDKMGPFFFLCIAMAFILDMKTRKKKVVHFSEE